MVSEELADEGGFASGCCAEVEHDGLRFDVLVECLLDEHRSGFLDVVASGVEEGVECELWSGCEVIAVDMPGNFVYIGVESEHIQLVV